MAASNRYADVLTDMRSRLQRWQEATADPILDGPMPVSATARVNDLDAVSPREPRNTVAEYPQW